MLDKRIKTTTAKKKEKEMTQRGQLLLIYTYGIDYNIYINRVLLGHLQTKSMRERESGVERVFKWVTRVIEDDDDDDCSHRC
jgi:hypothetical protein